MVRRGLLLPRLIPPMFRDERGREMCGKPTPGRFSLGTLGLVVFLTVAGCAPPSREALLVAQDLAAGDAPTEFKEKTDAPFRQQFEFEIQERRYEADLYLPAHRPEAGLLLIPGAAERGKDDPRLTAFARTLARARFRVLVPDLPGLRRLQISAENVDEVSATFRYLISGRDFPAPERAGIGAFSYAVGPVVLAASQKDLASQVDFILGVGGYFDLEDVLTFATTGYYRADGQWWYLEPNAYGKWVFVLGNLKHLPDAADRRALRKLAEWHLADGAGPRPKVTLGEDAHAVYRLVTNSDPSRVPGLIEQLPAGVRQAIDQLDLANKNLSRLAAELILVHGRNDPVIPYTQSLALEEAVPNKQAKVFIVKGLVHVDVKTGLIGRWRLWRAVDLLLRQRRSGSSSAQAE